MKKLLLTFLLGICFFSLVLPVQAAQIIGNDNITINEGQTNLRDLYLFGGNIYVNSPVTNDLVTGGGDIQINSDVTGSFFGGGGNITTRGNIGNTMRVAGGNTTIEGDIARDLVIAGGTVTISQDTTVGGDILFTGGNLIVDGSVGGKILINGGQVTINGPVGGSVEGNVGKLTLGPKALINGNLTYTSTSRATKEQGAQIRGQERFTQNKSPEKQEESAKEFLAAGAIYKLVTDIILSVLFIIFFGAFIRRVLDWIVASPIKSGAYGFAYLLLFPLLCLLMLVLIWLGMAGFLVYALTVLISIFLVKIFLGSYVLMWIYRWQKKAYALDWKAGVIGPILLFILLLIPIFGWIIVAFLMFMATGALIQELLHAASTQHIRHKHIPAKKSK